jgi:hypothetical protein
MKNKAAIPILLAVAAVAVIILFRPDSGPGPGPDNPGTDTPVKVEFVIDGPIAIERDYNQLRLVKLRNYGSSMAKVDLDASSGTDELLVGFAGRGTAEWEAGGTVIGIPPGETWELPILLHADRAAGTDYTITLTAKQGTALSKTTAEVKVARPQLALKTHWAEAETALDHARLARWLVIENPGSTVSDLSSMDSHSGTEALVDLVENFLMAFVNFIARLQKIAASPQGC